MPRACRRLDVLRYDDLGGLEPAELIDEIPGAGKRPQLELASRQIDDREPERAGSGYRYDVIIAVVGKQRVLEHGARCDHFDDVPTDDALGLPGVFQLFADGHTATRLEQP